MFQAKSQTLGGDKNTGVNNMCCMALSTIEKCKAGDGNGEGQVGLAGLFSTERSRQHSSTEAPF